MRRSVVRAFLSLACLSLLAWLAVWSEPASARRHHPPFATRPNIVFVLTDDLSMNLLRFMPHVQAMEQHGMTFDDYFVSDSLCCPSRSSIFTGNFPHDTGIYSNTGRHGGFDQFYSRGEEQQTFAVALRRAGYRTALMGKYLNGYMGEKGVPADAPPTYVPPGWSEWDAVGWGYPEFDYLLNHDGTLRAYGHSPADYLTDVLSGYAARFIQASASRRRPFFLEVATFAPHSPYVPAPRNAGDFPGLQVPRGPNFDRVPVGAPSWLAGRAPLTHDQIAQIDDTYRKRAQSVEAVDAMIGRIEETLRAEGIARNTYIVFSSDNGLHTGEYRLMPGKMTAFDTDIHVPLIVTGPGVAARARTGALAENIDLGKTFAAIGGTSLPSDGHSLLPLMEGATPPGWRDAVLIEHRGPKLRITDPDFQQPASGNPITYEAMRTHDFLYVEYRDGEREYYDLRADPFELYNLAALLNPNQLGRLHAELMALEHCHGGPACWAAMRLGSLTGAVARRRHHRR